MNSVFQNRDYNGPHLRSQNDYQMPKINTVAFGENSLRYLAPKIWNMLPKNIKHLETLNEFKNAIKMWVPPECPCRLCKQYIVDGLGFVNEV